MGAVADFEILLVDGEALAAEFIDLGKEGDGVHDDPVSDDTLFFAPEDPGRNEVQDVFGAALDDGMTGIVATGGTHHHVCMLRQVIDDFTFSFIAPLGTGHDHIGHSWIKN